MPMGSKARTAWNAANYTQIKIYADPELAAGFKARCAADEVSMASVLSQAMADYCKRIPDKKKADKKSEPDYSTKGRRRTATQRLAKQLEKIRDAEERYRDSMPENLQSSVAYENADQTAAALDDALEALSEAFQ